MAEGYIPTSFDGARWAFTTDTFTSLDSSNYYEFPSDGYVVVSATTAMTLYFSGYNYVKILSVDVAAGQKNMFFVKKGMIGKIQSGTGTANYFKMVHT